MELLLINVTLLTAAHPPPYSACAEDFPTSPSVLDVASIVRPQSKITIQTRARRRRRRGREGRINSPLQGPPSPPFAPCPSGPGLSQPRASTASRGPSGWGPRRVECTKRRGPKSKKKEGQMCAPKGGAPRGGGPRDRDLLGKNKHVFLILFSF